MTAYMLFVLYVGFSFATVAIDHEFESRLKGILCDIIWWKGHSE